MFCFMLAHCERLSNDYMRTLHTHVGGEPGLSNFQILGSELVNKIKKTFISIPLTHYNSLYQLLISNNNIIFFCLSYEIYVPVLFFSNLNQPIQKIFEWKV